MAGELPAPDQLGSPLVIPEAEPPAESKPARPTTRAGRKAAAEARRAAKAQRADTKPKRPATTKSDVAKSIESLHAMAGMIALPMLGLPQTGAKLAETGPEAGKVWADAVKRYPQLERLFGAGTDGLIIFRLLMVYAPIVSMAVGEKSAPKDGSAPAADPMAGLMAFLAQTPDATDPSTVPPGQNSNGRP